MYTKNYLFFEVLELVQFPRNSCGFYREHTTATLKYPTKLS